MTSFMLSQKVSRFRFPWVDRFGPTVWYDEIDQSMIRKSGNRFSEKIMLKQRDEVAMRFDLIAS
jgi:hypothetical protein